MSIIAEIRRTNGHVGRDAPRSPVSISTDSSRRNSLRPILPEKHSEPPTPVSPPASNRLSRKRAASLDTESANQPRIGDLALNSASTSNSANTTGGPSPISDTAVTEQVCLCQPDPKIPRPRNAFILYRQHYQAQVVAQNPGLANPEISKIIGEQWRKQAPNVKDEWKRLAEEEKQRHQRQYPNYRYQPRRAGKTVGNRPLTSTSDDPIRCPRCNGRYISTPSTPLTPFTPAFGAAVPRSDRLLPQFGSNNQTQQSQQSQYQPQLGELERPRYLAQMPGSGRVDSPRIGPPPQQMVRRHQYPQPLHTHHEHDPDIEMQSPSPEFKRRRFTNDPRNYPQPSPMTYSNPQQGFSRNQQIPLSAGPFRTPPQPLPASRPGAMGPPQSAPMRSLHMQQSMTPTYRNRTPTFDESLRLPPLQTQLPPPSSTHRSEERDVRHETRESQARSIEAMVMTIPYMNKLTILKKISPPLAAPGPTSPAQETRGAVIAVEGVEKGLIREVGDFIRAHLEKDPSCLIKTWVTETGVGSESREIGTDVDVDTEMRDVSESGKEKTKEKEKGKEKIKEKGENKYEMVMDMKDLKEKEEESDPFIEYLSTISQWHHNSSQITKFITTIPPSSPRRETSATSSTPHSSEVSQSSTPHKRTPIALIPHGYSLTLSDMYSLKLPINDSYAPVDHWQWMATLWRGIVGADLTVFVKGVGRQEMENCKGVEWTEGAVGKGIVVRILVAERGVREGSLGSLGGGDASAGLRKGSASTVESGGGGGGGERDRDRDREKEREREREKEGASVKEKIKGKMDEKTRRRLGFEVGEWVRGIDGGWGRS